MSPDSRKSHTVAMELSGKAAGRILSLGSLLPALLMYFRVRFLPWGMFLGMLSATVAAFSPVLFAFGLAGSFLSFRSRSYATAAAGAAGAALAAGHFWGVTHHGADLAGAFGRNWEDKINPERRKRFLQRRWQSLMPVEDRPVWQRDLVIPNPSGRDFLCDVWLPAEGTPRSGIAIIYVHGAAWFLMDKDYGTRVFFRRMTALGHVCVDVAYRLCPEVDLGGMVGDVKRAVAWTKSNAEQLGIRPDRIVLIGASSGAHIALLSSYAPHHPELTPPDLLKEDLTVRGVVSFYGPADLLAYYEHTRQASGVGQPKPPIGTFDPDGKWNNTHLSGRVDVLLGGHPSEVPERYRLASPSEHAGPRCPPTLQITGDVDCIAPVVASLELHRRLRIAGVPSAISVLPGVNHAFDLMLPRLAPAAQSAFYDLERFLGLLE
ncbi:Alpha/Beta hydrolase protein [Hyaloraphidium curvatum]|nr:Alpha/Beta hydrolase protein [Hyaloraphidium curvatum]